MSAFWDEFSTLSRNMSDKNRSLIFIDRTRSPRWCWSFVL